MKIVEMYCGPAASGKSFLVENKLREMYGNNKTSVTLFSPDARIIEMCNGEYLWSSDVSRKAWAAEYRGFAAWLRNPTQKDALAIWDATFTSSITRSCVLNFAKGFECYVRAVIVRAEPDECLRRNALRPLMRRVPDVKIKDMILTFQNDLPTLDEGFDDVVVVETPNIAVVPTKESRPCVFRLFENSGPQRCSFISTGDTEYCTLHKESRCVACGKQGALTCGKTLLNSNCKATLCGGGACSISHQHIPAIAS